MNKHIDMLIPTIGRPCLSTAINSVLNQTYQDWRLFILADGHTKEVEDIFLKFVGNPRLRLVYVLNGPLGNVGHHATRWAIENLDLNGWLYFTGDDDKLYPDAFQNYADAMDENTGMILGVARGVSRDNPNRVTRMLGEGEIKPCFVTGACGVYNLDFMRKLEAPIFMDSAYDSDWTLISRMMRFPYKRIPNIVTLFPLTGT